VKLLLREHVPVLRMPPDVRVDERADGHDAEAACAHVVERALHELAAEAVTLRLDLGMDERESVGEPSVADLAGELVAVVQLVAELRRVVDDAERRG